MCAQIAFNRTAPAVQVTEQVSPKLRRLVAANASPFTFNGTCSYIVGHGEVAIIDPGPDDTGHIGALLHATRGEKVCAILVTHTHRDHTAGVAALAGHTGAPVYGAGPHHIALPRYSDLRVEMDDGADTAFQPDYRLEDGDTISGPGWSLTALATPGHCATHLSFALEQDSALLSGDHVMAWSTSIVAPPDGSMGDYLISLEKLLAHPHSRYFPGHGGSVDAPHEFVRALLAHRRAREASVIAALGGGPATATSLAADIYQNLDPALSRAAALNILSHLEHLVEQNRVTPGGPAGLDSPYALA